MKGIKLSLKSKIQIMLVCASLGSILVMGYLNWSKSRQILTERIFSQLSTVRVSKAYQIETYLGQLRDQLETLCESPMVVDAMTEFDTEFDSLQQKSIPLSWDKELKKYYNREFLPKLNKNTKGTPVFETYRPITNQSRYLQYQYIANNPHPVGQKDKLEQAEDSSNYSKVHQQYHQLFRNLIKRFGYYDLFLIDAETGEIIYSVYKETDYSTSLYRGAYRNSNLAEVVRQVRNNPDWGAIQLIDFDFYRPSYNAPAAFIAGSIYDGSRRIGIIAVQLPIDEINRVLTGNQKWLEDGLGETGETYLVGEDLKLRSMPRLFLENPVAYLKGLQKNYIKPEIFSSIRQLKTPILLQSIKTTAAQEALEGKVGTQIIKGYRGQEVLSSYAPLDIEGINWGIISEMSLPEAYAPINNLQNYLLLSTVVLILLLTLLAAIAAQSVTQPIDKMIKRLRNLDGEGVVDLEASSQDELSELAEIMNGIGKRTRTLTKGIIQKNQELDQLLTNLMPASIVRRWQDGEQIVDRAQVVIVAIRIEGLEEAKLAEVLVAKAFNELITTLDQKGDEADIERLNCFGESYIAVCGLTKLRLDRVKRGVDFAQDALNLVKKINRQYHLSLNLRIGIDSGLVTAALIGQSKFRYDLWGSPVNIATQLAQQAEANTIRVTQAINTNVKDLYAFKPCEPITLMDQRTIPTLVLGKTEMNDLIGDITSELSFDFD